MCFCWLHWRLGDLVGEEGAEGRRVLHDERCDGQEGQQQHVHLQPASGFKLGLSSI